MRMRDDSCHAGVVRATDYYGNIEGAYLARTLQRGRAGSCEPAEPWMHSAGLGLKRPATRYRQADVAIPETILVTQRNKIA